MEEIIVLEDVCKTYEAGENEVGALAHISLRIREGEFVSITGASGSGKSTMMNIIGCLDTPTSGRYLFHGEDVSSFPEQRLSKLRNSDIAFIFQGFNLIPTLTAQENVELPLLYRGIREKQRREIAEQALEQVGLYNRRRHRPQQMSGGQQQRVAIARAIAASPHILLADEPTGNLDSRAGARILSILHALGESGKTVIVITHDPETAQSAKRMIRIQDGRIAGDDLL